MIPFYLANHLTNIKEKKDKTIGVLTSSAGNTDLEIYYYGELIQIGKTPYIGDGNLKIHYCGEDEIDIYGTKNDLLYLASRILEYAEEDCRDGVPAETNMDATIDYEGNIQRVCIFLENNGVR